jgi:hypothetical protein
MYLALRLQMVANRPVEYHANVLVENTIVPHPVYTIQRQTRRRATHHMLHYNRRSIQAKAPLLEILASERRD